MKGAVAGLGDVWMTGWMILWVASACRHFVYGHCWSRALFGMIIIIGNDSSFRPAFLRVLFPYKVVGGGDGRVCRTLAVNACATSVLRSLPAHAVFPLGALPLAKYI